MSVLNELQGLEDRVRERMRQLRPLVEEYRELEEVARRMGVEVDEPEAPKRRDRTGTPAKPAGGSPSGRSRTRTAGATKAAKVQSGSRRASARGRSARGGSRSNGSGPDAGPPTGRAAQLVEIVNSRPGITVREAGHELGVDPTYLYRVIRRLESGGALKKDGRTLIPA